MKKQQDQKPHKLNQEILDPMQKNPEIFENKNNLLQQTKKSNAQIIKQKYYDFFKDVLPDPLNYECPMSSDQQLEKHKIKCYDQNHSFNQPHIVVKNTQQQGTIVTYIVIIGMYELEITLLNLDQYANIQMNQNGSGLFESVRIQSQNKGMLAVKRRMFKKKDHFKQFNMMANKQEINQAIIQLAVYKICSLLKIGPAAETHIGFDLICYRDCIEFQIQSCVKNENINKSICEKQIKQCLLILYFKKLIHKDIKPTGILFSLKHNKYVFTDFGISQSVVEKIGYHSEMAHQGTILFIKQQMLQIVKGQSGSVQLYANDKQSNEKQKLKQQKKLYEYQYLKLKYYCIKLDSKMEEVQNYWRLMDPKRREQLISIVEKSIERKKIKSVHNFLSKCQDFKKYNLNSLRIQSEAIKLVKIDTDITQYTQLELKNTLRVYGYSKQYKMLIMKLLLQEKYKDILRLIDQKEKKDNQKIKFKNKISYTQNLKRQILQCQLKKDYQGIFKKCMILLSYGDIEQHLSVIKKLSELKYERTKDEEIEQIIRLYYSIRNIGLIFREQNNPEAAKAYNNIGIKYVQQCKYQLGLKYLLKSLDIFMTISEEPNIFILQTYKNLANVYDCLTNYDIALNYHKRIIDLQIKFYGQQDPNVALAYNNIAAVYKRMEKYETALMYYIKSLSIYIEFHGQQHINIAWIYSNIADVYHNMKEIETSLIYYHKCLETEISLLGSQHPSLARTYYNIAVAYHDLHNLAQSLRYCFKSIRILSNVYLQQYLSLSPGLYKLLSNIFLQKKIYLKSLHYAESSLYTFIKIIPLNNPQSAYIISLLATINQKMKKLIKAYLLHQIQYQLLLKILPDDHQIVRFPIQKMNKMEKSMPSLFHNYASNIQFINGINSKYKQLPKSKLLKSLLAKKWQLKFEQQYKTVRMNVDYLKCAIEVSLCYKYLGYSRQLKKFSGYMREESLRFEQSQQKSIFRDFIAEISHE